VAPRRDVRDGGRGGCGQVSACAMCWQAGTAAAATETGRGGPTWRVHGRRQRRGRVLVSPDHAAVAIKSPTEARCSQNACADWAEEALPHCQMERAYWRSALGAPSISALDALPAHLSIRHAIRRGVVSGRANHQVLTGEASARARVAMADRQPTTRRASTPLTSTPWQRISAPRAALPCTPPCPSAQTMQ
jgi:hypothetical protein